MNEDVTSVEQRVLDALADEALWTGDASVGGVSTSEVARRVSRRRSLRRNAVSDALTSLRRRGYLHYEYDRAYDSEVRWWPVK